MTAPLARVVIVGASLAGLRTAAALRDHGFTGSLTIVGDEPHPPYDRPPLSKQVLTDETAPDPALPVPELLGAQWKLGRSAVRLEPHERVVLLDDGTGLPYDGVVLATGSGARGWPEPRPVQGIHTLRTREDALRVRAELRPGRRVVVVGAGFLGGELAAAARARSAHVTLVEASRQPLERAIGAAPGAWIAGLHRESGVDLRTATTVTAFRADGDRVRAVALSDGTEHAADTVLLALGGTPATGWLAGSGLDLGHGVRCDSRLRALDPAGAVVPGVVAAGDVARVPQPLAGGEAIALGHWTTATEHAITAARTLLDPTTSAPHTAVPSFWSDLHGARIRSVGLPTLADEVLVHEHDLPGRHLKVTYLRRGRLIGALTVNRTRSLTAYRRELHAASEAFAP
ncbi:NAD(P)/FAD-dependent oxidoreductase [Amycolatopsis sp. DSM 110486]|uniref:NAD(P)/FAD-dependent oxidoreductase n=1 Tax=Amycolatopsis sp. DSM 110486 TaxID=2865832 RepID=UPI001C6A3A53|nr:FAD-dependent oxidoreductase [Amycolatopsis sp. DSM 110486]QYN18786.1 FAD-dependent oxidoreductase [Amycolatopsis sp. DSM 110486]